MDRDDIRKILAEAFEVAKEEEVDPETISDDVKLRDGLGVDSLDIMEVVFEIEERLRIAIAEDELAGIETVGQVIDLCERKLEEKEGNQGGR